MSDSFVFRTGKELLALCEKHKMPIWEVMLSYEKQLSGKDFEVILKMLAERLQIMRNGIESSVKNHELSKSGMAGKSTEIVNAALMDFDKLGEDLMVNKACLKAMFCAIATGENNARMGVILAFPTAGASGVLPGVIFAAEEKFGLSNEQLVQMMLTASAIGVIIANTATLSGAAGGCQAEIGSAAAMAAAALVEVRGKSPETALHAASLSLKNMIGLACDPIGGLVEVPCIKRNAVAAMHSIAASDLAFIGVESFVPFDEVVRAMREAGELMSPKFRETALGGLATTPTGQAVAKKMGLLQIGTNPCSL